MKVVILTGARVTFFHLLRVNIRGIVRVIFRVMERIIARSSLGLKFSTALDDYSASDFMPFATKIPVEKTWLCKVTVISLL